MIKKLLLTTMTVFFLFHRCSATLGEFNIQGIGTGINSISISIASQGYVWTWTNNSVMLTSAFSPSPYTSLPLYFASPTSYNGENQGVMPWGLMTFQISVNGGEWSRNFSIDFIDERWTDGHTYSDIYLNIRESDQSMYLTFNGEGSPWSVQNSAAILIWDMCNTGNPSQADFKIPLTIKNLVNSGNGGGSLHVDGSSYSSGSSVNVGYFRIIPT